MDSSILFANLRDTLASLYPEATSSRTVVDDAGLDARRIKFSDRAMDNWHAILNEAAHIGRIGDVLAVVRKQYGNAQSFCEVYDVYHSFVRQGGRLESSAPLSGTAEDRTSAATYGQQGQQVEIQTNIAGDKHEHHYHYAESPPTTASSPPMMALAPPDDFVQRPQEYDQLINYLLTSDEPTVAITATLKGAGGFGKTTIAQAICHDERIHEAFPDGILWTTIGDEGANVLLGLRKLYRALTGQEAQFVDQHDGTTQFSVLLADLRCLIVIDDVWNAAHLQPFLQGGNQCTRLVTTRIASVVPKAADVVTVDAMQVSEATALLGAELELTDVDALTALAQRLGEWPLLLKLVNRRLYEDVVRQGVALTDAIAVVNEELDEFGLTSFDAEGDLDSEDARTQAVAASIGISLKRLQTDAHYGRMAVDEVARFNELAIFPEDMAIPAGTLALLWQQAGNLSEAATRRFCQRLADLSLVLRYDKQAQTIQLHDVTRHYLTEQAEPEQYREWQRTLMLGYYTQCDGEWLRLADDGYVYQHLLWHMREAGQQGELEELLLTYRWLDAKLQATDIVSLIADFNLRRDGDRHSRLGMLQHALQLSVSVLARNKDLLVSQLYGRLFGLGEEWEALLDEVKRQERVRCLRSKTLSLTPPGGNLLYTLSDHTAGVSNLLLTLDGRLISSCHSSNDHVVRIWDIDSGTLLHSLEGHTDGISNILLASRNRLISSCGSGSNDHTVKVWNIDNGALLHSLEGHTAGVGNLMLTPDDHLVSSSGVTYSYDNIDCTIKVWDINNGKLRHSLEGHANNVDNLIFAPNGYIVSSCSSIGFWRGYTIKVWDINSGALIHALEAHAGRVSNLLLAPGGRLISSCKYGDRSIKIWDIDSGMLLHTLEAHPGGVDRLKLIPNGWLISCGHGYDYPVKVWDLERGTLRHSLEGHTAVVDNLLSIPDGRLISSCSCLFSDDFSSYDYTVKVWDINSGTLLHSLEGHTDGITDLMLTMNGYLISSCGRSFRDHSVKVWDIDSGVLVHSLEGHVGGVDNLLCTQDGRLISSCGESLKRDHSVKVWDIDSGVLVHSLEGHVDGINNLLCTQDGRLISSCGSEFGKCIDHTIKIWNIETDIHSQSVEGHTDAVENLLPTSNGYLVTSCGFSGQDSTVKVWGLESGTLLHSLEGHTSGVSNLQITPKGTLITSCGFSGQDSTVKVWGLESGTLLHSLEGHTSGVSNLQITPKGTLITSCGFSGQDSTVKVWDLESGTLLHSLEGHAAGVDNLLFTSKGHLISYNSGNHTLGPDNRSNYDETVMVWDVDSGTILCSLEGHTLGVSNLLLTDDGRLITSSRPNRVEQTIKIWDIERGILLHSLEEHTANVGNLLLTSDGRLISSCHGAADEYMKDDHTIKVWDIDEGKLLHSLEGHTGGVSNLLLTSDGRLISSCDSSIGDKDHTVKVWDIDEGKLLHSFEGHTGGVSNLLLTSDGRLISSCSVQYSDDLSVKMWDIDNGTLLYSLEHYNAPVSRMMRLLAPDYLVTAGGDRLNVWHRDNGEKIADFMTDGDVRSCEVAPNGTIIVGDGLGRVHFLDLIEPT